jgi:hypothetical protein
MKLAGCPATETCPKTPFRITHAQNDYAFVSKIAVIVEPRQHPLLVPIVQNFMQVLGEDWKIQIFHGTQNGDFIKTSSLNDQIREGRIYLSEINVANLDIAGYNSLFFSTGFWENLLGENILIFQTDTVLCKASRLKVEDFLKYDYVGAPWDPNKFNFICKSDGHRIFVGNGGLSIRKRSKSLNILKQRPVPSNQACPNEDGYFSCLATEPDSNFSVPTPDIAKMFSVETTFYGEPVGVHKPWPYLTKAEMDSLSGYCPKIDLILKPYYKW